MQQHWGQAELKFTVNFNITYYTSHILKKHFFTFFFEKKFPQGWVSVPVEKWASETALTAKREKFFAPEQKIKRKDVDFFHSMHSYLVQGYRLRYQDQC